MKLLLYCTKAKPYLLRNIKGQWLIDNIHKIASKNGKIVAECDFEVEEIKLIEIPEYAGSECNTFLYDVSINFETKTLTEDELCKQSCLTAKELDEYLDLYKEKEVCGYAIHIKNLHIFDEPRDLSYYHNAEDIMCVLTNAPQNMMYCYDYKGMERKTSFYKDIFEKKVLISIRPEWLCKILNGEKTIEVRKKVLKEMLNGN